MCRHFPLCGGCTFLNTSYKDQLINKRSVLQNLFPEWRQKIPEILESPQITHYRHKVQLPFSLQNNKNKRMVLLGCYARESHEVVNQQECSIQDSELSAVAWEIREWAQKAGLSIYNEKRHSGFLRHVLLRKGAGTGEILIGLVTNGGRPDGSRSLAKSILDRAQSKLGSKGTIVGIIQNVNTRATNVVLGSTENIWWGRPYLKEMLGKFKFKVELSTFFQVNPYQTPGLYNEVLRHIPSGSKVLDLYSGVGSIGLWLSSKAGEVTGIEENRQSVAAAKTAVSLNKIGNATFIAGDVTELLPRLCRSGYECAVIDPPRKGIDKKGIDSIKVSSLKRLVYVSCNPETLARDIRYLSREFQMKSLKGVDMFPHTEHIEAVAVLDRR